MLLALLFALSAHASPARDAILGTYHGANGCYLSIVPAAHGETDITFTDSMSDRTFWGMGRTIEAQLARKPNVLVISHNRASLGDVTAKVQIQLSNGVPAAMHGTVDGWGHAEVNCVFLSRDAR
jgi:hypothetical protein